MFKKLADGFQSTLAQAGEQAKARNGLAASSSPRTSTSVDRPAAPAGPAAPHVPYEEGNLESDNDEEKVDAMAKVTAGTDTIQDQQQTPSMTTSPDLQKRLNKLSKYETKYPELLKAYRALQAQDSNVKVFEKVLSDLTPATSVLDVEAFQQWANNFTLKAEMSMAELRRVSKEMESLQADVKSEREKYESESSERAIRTEHLESSLRNAESVVIDTDRIKELENALAAKKGELETTKTAALRQDEDLRAELETTKAEAADIQDQLLKAQRTITISDKQLEVEKERVSRHQLEASNEYSAMQQSRDSLRKELIDLKVSHAQEIHKIVSQQTVSSGTNPSVATSLENVDESQSQPDGTQLSKAQRKRKNKKKASAKATDELENPIKETEMICESELATARSILEDQPQIAALMKERDNLQLELLTLRAQSEAFTDDRSAYERTIKKLREHQESVEEMRDMVKDVGNDLVEARDEVKELSSQHLKHVQDIGELRLSVEALEQENAELKKKLASLDTLSLDTADIEEAKNAANEAQSKLLVSEDMLKRVTRDLDIAEKLSAERFKDLASTKDTLRLQTSELNELRRQSQRVAGEKSSLEVTLRSTEARIKALERAEKDRRDELEKSQKNLTSREKELKVIQSAFKEEEMRRKSEETRAASLKSEVNKLTSLRDSIIASRNELTSQVSSMKADLDSSEAKMASLQLLKNKLTLERDAAQEELQLGKAKFASSYSLMESQQEQTIDMQHRLRESIEHQEAMEDELSEAQRQLTERGREAETLRRLLSEIEGGQESRLREMRERMDSAISERDKAEDEAAFLGKKRAREVEDLKERLLDIERTQRKLVLEKQDLTALNETLQKAAEQARIDRGASERDAKEMRDTMSELSQSMREAESQISTLEGDREALRAAIKESTNKIDRLTADLHAKDDLLNKLRTERAHLLDRQEPFQSPLQARRTSHQRTDSMSSVPGSPSLLRSPSMQSISLAERPREKSEVDREYIKNVLFQFLEHKEKRKYLMPAISKLLLLSKQQEGVFANSLK